MSNKIDLDKYYTPLDKAKYCIDRVYQIIGENNISEVMNKFILRIKKPALGGLLVFLSCNKKTGIHVKMNPAQLRIVSTPCEYSTNIYHLLPRVNKYNN
jgi:hypothetical protein